jgi:Fic family protein
VCTPPSVSHSTSMPSARERRSALSEVAKAFSHPRPRIHLVSFLLSAVNVYRRPLASSSSTISGNSASARSATQKLGTNGVSPPDGGGTSQNRITFPGNSLI